MVTVALLLVQHARLLRPVCRDTRNERKKEVATEVLLTVIYGARWPEPTRGQDPE